MLGTIVGAQLGCHFIPADVSYLFLTVPLDSLGYNMYNALHPIIGSSLPNYM